MKSISRKSWLVAGFMGAALLASVAAVRADQPNVRTIELVGGQSRVTITIPVQESAVVASAKANADQPNALRGPSTAKPVQASDYMPTGSNYR